MTLAHQDISERLVDYLFGELDEPARAAFEEHLAACEGCRTMVEATGKARAMARQVARAPLDEPVPLGVRARVLAAAAAAAEERRAAAATTTVAAAAAAAIAAAGPVPGAGEAGAASSGSGQGKREHGEPPRRGWFDWLRGRWAFPTLATVAAMAVFFLVRGTIVREAQHPLGDSPAEKVGVPGGGPTSGAVRREPAPAVAPVVEKSPSHDDGVQGQSGAEPVRNRVRVRASSEQPRELGKGTGAPVNAVGGKAKRSDVREGSLREPRASSGSAARATSGNLSDRLEDPSRGRAAEPEEGSLSGKSVAKKVAAHAESKEDRPVRAVQRPRAPAKADLDEVAPSVAAGESRAFSTPPPAAPAAAPAGGAAPAAVAAAARSSPKPASAVAEPPSPSPADGRGSVARLSDERSSDKKAKVRAADEAPAAESAQAKEEVPGADENVRASRSAPDPARALAQRADQLLAARRWSEASAAYRDLLRQFPHDPAAPRWRARLATADRAAAAARTDAGAGSSGFATPPPAR